MNVGLNKYVSSYCWITESFFYTYSNPNLSWIIKKTNQVIVAIQILNLVKISCDLNVKSWNNASI